MPVTPTYPGVYIEEVPSGVRTITGVSTSVTAFVGQAKRGPVNKAVHILSYSDFERNFGGLYADSQMSYAIHQFFLNGGTEAWVVRLAKDPTPAHLTLQNAIAANALEITALDEGKAGNSIEMGVDYQTSNPASTFNLSLNYTSKENPAEDRNETFLDLSMNSKDARYVEDKVNGISKLVKVERVHNLAGLGKGISESGRLTDVAMLLDSTHNQFRISLNGANPIEIQINLPADVTGADAAQRLAALCTAIQTKVQTTAVGAGFTCTPNASSDGIVMTSGITGETSTVRVLGGLRNDAASRLKLGTVNGGVETDAVATIRPAEMPKHGTLTSGVLVNVDVSGATGVPRANNSKFQISIDGYGPDMVDIGPTAAAGANLQERLQDIAKRIQNAVQALKSANTAYNKFSCTVSGSKLVLSSGSLGSGSRVVVTAVSGDGLASGLKLLAGIDGAVAVEAINIPLQGGNENSFTDAEAYNIYIASRSDRQGIYALESVDIFNLLCLPGVADSGILMDTESYCRERRAFMVADPPLSVKTPSEMSNLITGTALPKTEYGAVYYPWLKIADPSKGGKLNSFPPSGTIAGLYARTDSTRGVWKAPAGTDATLTGVQGVEYTLTDQENGTLNPLGVNCIRILTTYGAVAWGARTLRGADQMTSEYKYIPVRRMALYIEESLYRGMKWVVFEPNDEPLWAQIRLNVGAFMHNLFRQGAFQGTTPREAYFVKCDKETTTQNDINLGIVNIVVGFAPLKPAEFVIIKIQQIAGQIEA